jgi:hypothetical protein
MCSVAGALGSFEGYLHVKDNYVSSIALLRPQGIGICLVQLWPQAYACGHMHAAGHMASASYAGSWRSPDTSSGADNTCRGGLVLTYRSLGCSCCLIASAVLLPAQRVLSAELYRVWQPSEANARH